MNKAIKRIINKDLKSIEHNKLNDNGIYVEFDEENMLRARVLIVGPEGSLYEGGYFFFYITIITYRFYFFYNIFYTFSKIWIFLYKIFV